MLTSAQKVKDKRVKTGTIGTCEEKVHRAGHIRVFDAQPVDGQTVPPGLFRCVVDPH